MVNKYIRKICKVCKKETLHNYNSCVSCACKKQYYSKHKYYTTRGRKFYNKNKGSKNLIYTQKQVNARRKKVEFKISREYFFKWFDEHEKICEYCGRTEEEWNKTKTTHIQHIFLTLDRKDNNKGYVEDNICWSCIQCNTYKKSRSYEEFKQNWQKIYLEHEFNKSYYLRKKQ